MSDVNGTDEGPVPSALATVLAGLFTALATILGFVGGATGGLARMIRNEPQSALLALALIVASIAGGFLARYLGGLWRPVLLTAASILFVVGVSISLFAEVHVMSSSDRPALIASWKTASGLELSGSTKASGLKATDQIQVAIYGMSSDNSNLETLYYSKTGPNSDGEVDHSFSVPVVTSRYKLVLVTANLGDRPASCDGQPLEPGTVKATGVKGQIKNACLQIPVPSSPTTTTP